jgi:hypothetical protein
MNQCRLKLRDRCVDIRLVDINRYSIFVLELDDAPRATGLALGY